MGFFIGGDVGQEEGEYLQVDSSPRRHADWEGGKEDVDEEARKPQYDITIGDSVSTGAQPDT